MKRHMELLGCPVKDRVTGIEGIATSICFDLYGCIQAIVNPGLDKEGKPQETLWYDVSRLERTGTAVMRVPDFNEPRATAATDGRKGPAERPMEMKP